MGGVTFHVVHSVKGGCGKTAFSLFTALRLAAEAAETAEKTRKTAVGAKEDRARVLLLDADFKGSGLKTLLYSKDQETFDVNREMRLEDFEEKEKSGINAGINYLLFRRAYQKNNLNDFLTGKCHSISEITAESGVIPKKRGKPAEEANGFNGYLDFIFCSPRMKDRDLFSYANASQPAISVGRFRIKARELLEQISACKDAAGEGQYKHVVIDMPPGYDEYSDVLLDVLRHFCRDDKEKKICYYAVTTGDRSHLDAMRENVEKVLQGSGDCRDCDRVCVVFSEVRRDEFEKESPRDCADKYCAGLRDRITLQKCCYQEEYYDFCRMNRDSFGYSIESFK